MKMKISELTGLALDWAVAKCQDLHTGIAGFWSNAVLYREENPYCYSTDWAIGGPIIEREKIELRFMIDADAWYAQPHDMDSIYQRRSGPTPLIAAMRCYVASKLGDDVDVPGELT